MRVVVTNDDGHDAPGLLVVVAALARSGHDVAFIAPSQNCNGGIGTSMRVDSDCTDPLQLTRPIRAPSGVKGWRIDGPPAMAAQLACSGKLVPNLELLIAGVNLGPNVGNLALHSGTFGAALTSVCLGVPAIAVSLDDVYSDGWLQRRHPVWDEAAEMTAHLVSWLGRRSASVARRILRGPLLVNLNVPNRKRSDLRGVAFSRFARLDAPGCEHVRRTARDEIRLPLDVDVLVAGKVSISVMASPFGSVALRQPLPNDRILSSWLGIT